MRSNEITSDSAVGVQAPERPVPEPRAVTGSPSAAASASNAATSAARVRPGDERRADRGHGQGLVMGEVVVHGRAGVDGSGTDHVRDRFQHAHGPSSCSGTVHL